MRAFQALICTIAVVAAVPLTYSARLDTGASPVLAGRHVGTFPQALRVFGKPDDVRRVTGQSMCVVAWRRHGLEMRFHTTGGCGTSQLGSWWQVSMRDLRWHTRLGLHVGDSESKLSSLYPDAMSLRFLGLGDLRELETGGPLCDGGPPLALAGRIVSGRVGALVVVHVPACG
jgi:hypothetical protein